MVLSGNQGNRARHMNHNLSLDHLPQFRRTVPVPHIRLGILQVNHDTSDDIGNSFPDDAHRFRDLFDGLDQRFTYRIYMTIGGEIPASVKEQDAFLITGSPLSVLDDLHWKQNLFAFIRACDAAKKPLIGCCFGHQAIALALDGEIEKVAWNVGVETTHFKWADLPLYVFHHDQVKKLPPGVERIAKSSTCPNAGFSKGQHILTTQAHPEFTPRFMEALVGKYGSMLGDKLVNTRKSLNQETQGSVFAQWATNCILRAIS